MTPEAILIELLDRVGSQNGSPVVITNHDLKGWPGTVVAVMKAKSLLSKSQPATSAVCPGCEKECVMPVHVQSTKGHTQEGFVVCDKRSDINRVSIPVSSLEQWQISGYSIAGLLTDLLGLIRSGLDNTIATRWEIGLLKGTKHSSHLVLIADNVLTLSMAGHSIGLTDVLTFEDETFKVDKNRLIRMVDQPVAGAGDTESAAQRRKRLKKRVDELKAKGVRAFLKTVAEEEGISVSRLKQLI